MPFSLRQRSRDRHGGRTALEIGQEIGARDGRVVECHALAGKQQ